MKTPGLLRACACARPETSRSISEWMMSLLRSHIGTRARRFHQRFVTVRGKRHLTRASTRPILAEISCVTLSSDTNSQRNEHVGAFNKSRACIRRALRFGRISVGSGAECIAAVAPARPPGRKSCGAQLRGDDDSLRQLQSCCSCPVGQCTDPARSISKNSGVDPAVGSIAFSWRTHFRACAACARLST